MAVWSGVGWVVAHSLIVVGVLWLLAELKLLRLRFAIQHRTYHSPIPALERFAMLFLLFRVRVLGLHFDPIEAALERRRRYGKAYIFYRGSVPVVFASELDDIKKILLNTTDEFTRARMPQDAAVARIFGKSLLAEIGESWHFQRRTCEPGFKYKRIKDFIPLFSSLADKVIRNWNKDIGNGDKAIINVEAAMTAMTQDAIGLAGFSYDFKNLDQDPATFRQRENYEVMMAGMLQPLRVVFPFLRKLPTAANKRINTAIDELSAMLGGIINQRRKMEKAGERDGERADLLDHILALKDEGGMSDEIVLHNLFLFFVAGHDTSSSVMTSALYFLAKHPDIQEKAYKEACEVLDQVDDVNYDHFRRLEFVNNCIRETLRVHPPVPFTPLRKCTKDGATLGDYVIPKGQIVLPDIIAINYDERLWPEPHRFNPDRFTTCNKHIDPAQLLSFSVGPRICLGMKFALAEMTVVLALLLRQFKFALPKDFVWHYRVFKLTLGPENGLPLIVQKRE